MSFPPLPARQPAKVAPAATPGLSELLTLAVAVVVVAALFLAREVLIPITLGVLLSFLVTPLVTMLNRARLGRVPSVLVALVIALGLILSIGGLIGTQMASLVDQVPRYQSTVEQKVEQLRGMTLGRLQGLAHGWGEQISRMGPAQALPNPAATEREEEDAGPKPMQVEVHHPSPSPMDLAERFLAPVLGPLSTTAIVFIFATFILLQRQDLRDRMIRLFGSEDLHRTTVAMDDAAARLSRYFLTQMGINAAFGVIIFAGLALIGVPSPLLWGIVAMLLRFVPYIGAPLAALAPMALAAAVDPGWSTLIWTGGLFLVCEGITGQVIEPMLYGHSTGLSPLSVVLAATFWTWLWGPIGLILSTPLTLCLLVLGRHVKRLEFLDVLLGDRPALTPVESFYQRLLAGDPDEALDQAERLLKTRALSAYYDEVALKGLQLAANDAMRGVLTDVQLERIRTAIRDLVEDLDSHDDVTPPGEADEGAVASADTPVDPQAAQGQAPEPALLPPPWGDVAPVMCVAGRGVLDEAASGMLAQLLGKHGLGASVVPSEMVSRGSISALELRGVAMVCVSYLELDGSTSHLRYMLRRIRQRLPEARILVCLWPVDGEVLRDERLRAAVGADVYAATLREAVEACVQAARAAAGVPDVALAGPVE